MTRDELKTSIKNILTNGSDGDIYEEILDTIFAALKEPTDEMVDAFCEQPSYEETADKSWKLMLNASPLKPKE